jgi:hypothetical protein
VTPEWKIPAQLHSFAYRRMQQISRHEFIVLEMVMAILVLAVLGLLLYLRLSSA